MDIERHLISTAVRDKSIAEIAKRGITADFFVKKENREVVEAIFSHHREYGSVPTYEVLHMDFPNFKFENPKESLDFLIDRLGNQRQWRMLDTMTPDLVDLLDANDVAGARALMNQTLQEVEREFGRTENDNLSGRYEATMAEFEALWAHTGALRGIPTGFSSLDRNLQGLQGEQLVTVVGPPKAGKSTVFTLCALAAWNHAVSPLVVSFEMSNKEQRERMHCIDSGVSHTKFRNNTLSSDEKRRLEKSVKKFDSGHDFHMAADPHSSSTLSGIRALIDEMNPDIIFVDGVYMMQDENGEAPGSPQALTNITRGFKRMAMKTGKPIVISTQALLSRMDKKRGVTAEAIGYSSSFAQDSDVVIGVSPHASVENVNQIKVIMARNAPPMETFVSWDWEHGTFEELPGDPENEGMSDGDSQF